MSTNLPPTGPPSGPPPAGPPPGGTSEILEQGGGGPVPPHRRTRGQGGGRRRGLVIGGVIGALAVGGAAVGGYAWLTSTGPQPAEALPAGTLGYVSIDLDPSGSQKIAALKTLEKFPAAERWLDDEGIGSGDDIRRFIVGKIQEEEGACAELDFEADIEPWLGDRFAVAAVDGGEGETPLPVGVIQVEDPDSALDSAEQAIETCGGDPDAAGLAMSGDWLVVAETDEIAEQVADDAAEASLADDEEFQEWTEAAGDPGILTAYVSAGAGKVLADELGALTGPGIIDCSADQLVDACPAPPSDDFGNSALPDGAAQAVEDFGGAAVTVRFDDGSLEVETAGDPAATGLGALASSGAGAEVVSTLPEDTAAAFGLGFEPGWFEDLLDYVATMSGAGADVDAFLTQAEEELGLSLPEDAETLLGESAAVAVGADFDPEAFFNSLSGPAQLPIGLKIKGDPDAIEEVLDKVRATAPSPDDAEILGSESDDGYVAVGPNPDYLSQLLDDGDLGSSATFRDVVREDDPSAVFFVSFDAGDDWLANLAGDDSEIRENLDPLAGLGITGWEDDGVAHAVLRVTTD
jgi:hypothetical protein